MGLCILVKGTLNIMQNGWHYFKDGGILKAGAFCVTKRPVKWMDGHISLTHWCKGEAWWQE